MVHDLNEKKKNEDEFNMKKSDPMIYDKVNDRMF